MPRPNSPDDRTASAEDVLRLDIVSLARGYDEGTTTPEAVISELLRRIEARGADGVWITVAPRATLVAAAHAVERRRAAGEHLPLYGIPFAVKDNIDVAGLPTTAACPAFAYTPSVHARVVARLIDAGAIPIGKTNLDQFATGLVGVRSPYGIPRNPFDPSFITGGSSSGSAVAVAVGLCSFALGTDTAGSGRVPAAFNNIVGLKPSRGVLSTTGVVPACRSLDCVSVFALTCGDAARVAEVAAGYDADDPYARPDAGAFSFAPQPTPPHFRFALPDEASLDFRGDERARGAFEAALAKLAGLGGEATPVDFTPFRTAAALLYDGPFVAQRLEAAGRLLAEQPDALLPPIRAILEGATRCTAQAAFDAEARLQLLRRQARATLAGFAFLLVPSAPTIYRIDEVEAEPLALNATLGTYVNFVNLLDLTGLAVPGGFRDDGLPAGVTLIGVPGTEGQLAGFGARLHVETSKRLGATTHALPIAPAGDIAAAVPAPELLTIAVVGAHLSGQPLNHQLTERGARFVRATQTAPVYRLFALPATTPPKPGLVRATAAQPAGAIEVELWALSPAAFGDFVARVPAPLCIGSVELADGTRVSGFLCEPRAIEGARDITSFAGWRAFLAANTLET